MIMSIIGAIFIMYAWKKAKNKKITSKTYITLGVGFIFFLLGASHPLEIIKDMGEVIKIPQVFIMLLVVVCAMTFLDLTIKFRNKYYEIDALNDDDILKRTIDFEYNPSIASFLFEHKVGLKELSADILYLHAKKVLKIEKNRLGKYELSIGEKYNEYKEELTASDEYIVEYVKNNWEFDVLKWKEKVREEYDSLGFVNKKEHISDKTFYIIMGVIIFGGMYILQAIYNIDFADALMYVSFFSVIVTFGVFGVYSSVRTRYLLPTRKGKEAIKQCIKLKKFMEEYTLLKDRTVEEIRIYEKYIPYAVALDVNKKYEGTIFEIFGQEIYKIVEDIDILEHYQE